MSCRRTSTYTHAYTHTIDTDDLKQKNLNKLQLTSIGLTIAIK